MFGLHVNAVVERQHCQARPHHCGSYRGGVHRGCRSWAGRAEFPARIAILRECPSQGTARDSPGRRDVLVWNWSRHKQRREARSSADHLREEIGQMATDGSLAGIDFRWHTSIGTSASTIFQYGRARFYLVPLVGCVRGAAADACGQRLAGGPGCVPLSGRRRRRARRKATFWPI